MRVLWVGRIDPVKRAEIILQVARDCPDIEFDLVGPPGSDERYVSEILNQAKQLNNVTWHGAADFADIATYYQQAKILCCTSEFEGFPNTFLEAWGYGVPVISTVDPDDIIARHNLGAAVSDPKTIGEALKEVAGDPEKMAEMAKAAHDYFLRKHDKNTAMGRFESLLETVIHNKQDNFPVRAV